MELHSTDNPFVYVDDVPVLMEVGDWAVKDANGKVTIEKAKLREENSHANT